MKKRLTIGLIVGTAVFAAVFGMAANLGVQSDSLGAGAADVVSCDDSISVAYTTGWNATAKKYVVNTITVSGIDGATCAGHKLSVTVLDGKGAVLGSELTDTVASTDSSKTFSGLTLAATNVEDVHAALTE